MKSDLQELVISEKEFKGITGIAIKDVEYIRENSKKKFILKKLVEEISNILIHLFIYILLFSLILCILVWIVFKVLNFVLFIQNISWSLALRFSLYISISFSLLTVFSIFKDVSKRKKMWKSLVSLFEDFEKYNQVIQAINVKDQLEEVGSIPPDIQGREALLQTLVGMRQDLTRALKTERILRENSQIVSLNAELFESSFTAIKVEQINLQGNEYSRLVNETLKIGMSVRNEMKHLQTKVNS